MFTLFVREVWAYGFLHGWFEVPILMRRNRASRPSKVEVNPDDELSMYVCDYTYKTPRKLYKWMLRAIVNYGTDELFLKMLYDYSSVHIRGTICVYIHS